MTKRQLLNQQQTIANMILIISIVNRNNLNKFELAPSHARIKSIKFTKHGGVSEWVS